MLDIDLDLHVINNCIDFRRDLGSSRVSLSLTQRAPPAVPMNYGALPSTATEPK